MVLATRRKKDAFAARRLLIEAARSCRFPARIGHDLLVRQVKVEQVGPRHGVESPRTGFRLFGDRPNKAGELARNRVGDHGLQLPRMLKFAIPTA